MNDTEETQLAYQHAISIIEQMHDENKALRKQLYEYGNILVEQEREWLIKHAELRVDYETANEYAEQLAQEIDALRSKQKKWWFR